MASSIGSADGTGRRGRKARLADELRANLQRRKEQARARRGGDADLRPDGLPAAGEAPRDRETERRK